MNVSELEIWPAGQGVDVNTWPTWEETEAATTNLELWVEENIYSGKFFVLFPSCRSAIYHILYAEGLSRADSVSISKWSSHCVISAVGRLAEPAIESSKKSKAVLINHQYGIHKMLKDADNYSLIIEDSCDSLICVSDNFCLNGGRYEVLSLPKIFGTGWGGGVIAKNYDDAKKLRKLRDEKKYAYAKEQFRLKQLYYN